ncbi:hypothetical protein [Streptomyces celluloflavus]|uniref:hypothetical protein n=1 Tax=Streptomyces celluloflavus TaxID=58344 RepID=UPI0036913917
MDENDTTPPSRRTLLSAGRVIGAGLLLAGLLIGGLTVRSMLDKGNYQHDNGVLTVDECRTSLERSRSRHQQHVVRHVSCTGTFRFDATSKPPLADIAVETGREVEPGTELDVVKSSHSFELAEDQNKSTVFMAAFGSLLAVAAGAFCLLTGFGGRRGPRFRPAWAALPAGRVTRPLLAVVGGIGIAGTAVSLIVYKFVS